MTDTLNQHIADRIRHLRTSQSLSLDALEIKSGVSRSMISLIERGESNPTAIVLDKLATALGIPLSSLFLTPTPPISPISRRESQPEWKDPASGYLRRQLTPSNSSQPIQLTEIHFPPGKTVAFESPAPTVRLHQQIWLLEGSMQITLGQKQHHLTEGDCLAMQLGEHTVFHNPTDQPARYLVAIASEPLSKR